MVLRLLLKALLVVGLYELQISEKGQVALSNMCCSVQPTTVITQAFLQQADELI
jgi:hypothetical protein